jgi:ABC-type maltose transport system permease subunit
MNRTFWIVETLIIATFTLAIAIAYIHGVEEGMNTQQYRIKMLEEQLHPGLIIDYFPYLHPLRNALFGIGFSLTLCWIGVAAIVLGRRKNKSKA